MSDVVIQAEGLRKSFGTSNNQVRVLDGLDLTLGRGEVLALLGPNGAGKTTTVRILATLLPPDGGRALVAGCDVVHQARQVRERISLTGQHVALDAKQTARENLTMMGHLAHMSRAQVRARVSELLDGFDLADAADRRISTFSGGMRRRLDLAAGLLARPAVMFLDEPTTGLDPRSRQSMWQLTSEVVAQGTSVLLTTQYLDEADQLANRVALVDDGRVVAQGAPAQLKAQVGDAGIEIRCASADADAVRAALEAAAIPVSVLVSGVIRVPTDRSIEHVRGVLGVIEATGCVPQNWEVREPTLDDVFLTLTGHATTIDEMQEVA